MLASRLTDMSDASLSARRAWIEMTNPKNRKRRSEVALRKESVDRNYKERPGQKGPAVALRKESVDRNNTVQVIIIIVDTSLSARRAWIEINLSR